MSVHSKNYSASASERWLNCPASVNVVCNYENKSSSFADEGTCAHALAELVLKNAFSTKELQTYVGHRFEDVSHVVNEEMLGYVDGYADYCRSFAGDMYVEERVSYELYAPGGFGTADCIIINDNETHIIDLKYGRGIAVDVENNTQAMLYALGVVLEFDFIYEFAPDHVFTLHIYQPRINNICEWSTTRKDLESFGEYVRARVELSKSKDAYYSVSEKGCRWCPHKANCTAMKEFAEQTIMSQFDNLDLPDVATVDFKSILDAKPIVEAWLKAVEELAHEKLLAGQCVDGYKLVGGRSSRKWSHGARELLEQNLQDDAYEKKLITVPQAEKKIGKKNFAEFEEFVIKTNGAPVLAKESDKRKAFSFDDVTELFENLES